MLSRLLFAPLTLISCLLNGQYTDQINSNRPGISSGAFSVGRRVLQLEGAVEYRSYRHARYNESLLNGRSIFFSFRTGIFSDRLEFHLQTQHFSGLLIEKGVTPTLEIKQKGYIQNFIGFKYLIFDPYKNKQEVNLYSWKANNSFQLKDLIPAISIIAGTNLSFENQNPFPYGNTFSSLYQPIFFQNIGIENEKEPFFNYRAVLVTQSHFLKKWVLVSNFMLDRITTKYPEMSYAVTLTHSFSPTGSVYIENQGIYGTFNSDFIFRTGLAFLLNNDLQIDFNVASNLKTTPSLFLTNLGFSYRLDFHKDYINLDKVLDNNAYKERKREERRRAKNVKKSKKNRRKVRKI